jgi:lipopolysaccharide transport system ATP-binding protein
MYVRLAFAVAAHLEPEILIIDEVLAVGDAEFQKKCLGKMEDVSKNDGRTVLFVSHNMGAISNLCNNCIMLEKGKINLIGATSDIIHNYLHSAEQLNSSWRNLNNQYLNTYFTPISLSIVDSNLNEQSILPNNERIGILIEGEINNIDPSLAIGIAVYSSEDQLLFWALHTDKKKSEWVNLHLGVNQFITWIPKNLLNEGDYRVELNVSLHFKEWILQPEKKSPSVQFSVHGGLSESPHWQDKRPGLLAPILSFQHI